LYNTAITDLKFTKNDIQYFGIQPYHLSGLLSGQGELITVGQYFSDGVTNIEKISHFRLICQYAESLRLPKMDKECLFLNLEYGSSGCPIYISKEEWLTSYLIDHLKQHLATYTEVIINNEGTSTHVRIYYDPSLADAKDWSVQTCSSICNTVLPLDT
jgi:hypothetical protein